MVKRINIAKFSRQCGHKIVDYTIPRNATIASISAGAGVFGRKYVMTYGPGMLAGLFANTVEKQRESFCDYWICRKVSDVVGHITPVFFVPETSIEISTRIGILTSLVTCVSLNILTALVYGPVKDDAEEEKEVDEIPQKKSHKKVKEQKTKELTKQERVKEDRSTEWVVDIQSEKNWEDDKPDSVAGTSKCQPTVIHLGTPSPRSSSDS